MITVIIKDNGEPNVIKLTYENLWKELKDISDASLIVSKNWFDTLGEVKTKFVCFVESDCLVNSGYFSSQLGLFKKDPYSAKLAILSSSIGVNDWANKFYGYSIGDNHVEGVIPNKQKKSTNVYPVQIGFIPGAVIRTEMLGRLLEQEQAVNGWEEDLLFLSTKISLGFWRQGIGKSKTAGSPGNRTHINPNTCYVTTETYVNDIGHFEHSGKELYNMFKKESI